MEIVIAAVVLAAGLVGGASLLSRRSPALAGPARPTNAPVPVARDHGATTGADGDLKERRTEIVRLEERLLAKEAALENQRAALTQQEQQLDGKRAEIETVRERARSPAATSAARCLS